MQIWNDFCLNFTYNMTSYLNVIQPNKPYLELWLSKDLCFWTSFLAFFKLHQRNRNERFQTQHILHTNIKNTKIFVTFNVTRLHFLVYVSVWFALHIYMWPSYIYSSSLLLLYDFDSCCFLIVSKQIRSFQLTNKFNLTN